MKKIEIQQQIKQLDILVYKLNNEMNGCWEESNKNEQKAIKLKYKIKKMSLTQKIFTRILLGGSGVLFATAIFVNPFLLFGSAVGLCSAFIYSEIVNKLIEKNEQIIKNCQENHKINREKQEKIFNQIEELKVKRFSLMTKLEELNAENKVQNLGQIKPIENKYKKITKRGKSYER